MLSDHCDKVDGYESIIRWRKTSRYTDGNNTINSNYVSATKMKKEIILIM